MESTIGGKLNLLAGGDRFVRRCFFSCGSHTIKTDRLEAAGLVVGCNSYTEAGVFVSLLKRVRYLLTLLNTVVPCQENYAQFIRRANLFGDGSARSALLTQQLDQFRQIG